MRNMLRERNEALLSLDENKLRSYARRYGVEMPRNPEAFWAGIHKARVMWTDCPDDKRMESVAWLQANGFGVPL